MRTVFALAALAAIGFSGAAFAGDATTGAWSTTATPATPTAPTAMSDSDMDKVTAGLTGGIPNSINGVGSDHYGADVSPGAHNDGGNAGGVTGNCQAANCVH